MNTNTGESDGVRYLEEWSYRLLLATVFAMMFSIALGNVMMALVIIVATVYLVLSRQSPPLPPVVLLGAAFVFIAFSVTRFGFVEKHSLGRLIAVLLLPIAVLHIRSEARIAGFVKAVVFGALVLSLERCIVVPLSAWKIASRADAGAGFVRVLINKGSMTDGQMLMLGILGSIALIYVSGKNFKRVMWWRIVLLIQVIALIINFKRGSWICACIFASLLVVSKSGWRALFILLLTVGAVLFLPPVHVRMRELSREFNQSGGRLTMWREIAPAIIKQHPFGVGYGSLTNDMMRAHASDVERDRDHLHSNLPQVLVETGWTGFIVYILWMVTGMTDGWRGFATARRSGSANSIVYAAVCPLMFASLLTNGLVEYNFGDTELFIMYITLLGIMACVRKMFC
ncbi:MAG: hypothetical protein JXN60_09405 [Lentisphaerae bacterium]|nr:hypothetical protein [Lentisphaerota bacterium]